MDDLIFQILKFDIRDNDINSFKRNLLKLEIRINTNHDKLLKYAMRIRRDDIFKIIIDQYELEFISVPLDYTNHIRKIKKDRIDKLWK